MDGLRYSPDDPYYRLGPVNTCLYVRACRLVTGTSSGSEEVSREASILSREAPIFFRTFFHNFFLRNWTRFFFPLNEIGQGFRLQFWDLQTLHNLFPA